MRLVLILTAIFAATAARAAPMSFDAALAAADRSAPSLEARNADVQAARSSSVAAGRLPDPKLRLGLDNFPVSGPPAWRFGPDSMTMASVGLMQDVPNGAKRQAARQRAAADIGAAEAAQRVEARTVRVAVALAWIDLYYAERRLAALDEIERALAALRATAPSQLAAGAARPAQTLEAERMTAALGDRRAELAAAIGKARAELARWTGDAEADVAGSPPGYSVDPVALRAGLDRSPSLRVYDAMERQADADLAAAKAEKRPDWGLDVAYQHRDPMWGEMVSAGVTVSLPIFSKSRQDPIIAARALTAGRVRAEREAARRALAASLDGDLADHAMHHDRLMRSQQTLLPLAKRRADLETASYAAGNADLSDVLEAALAYAEDSVEAIDREADVRRDAVRITLTYRSEEP
ncbi:MAG TPA: TolC family protein [Caulobacteraceae bacterium]|jgi:outer membrane protein TolC|nr:TolC family protein [Caulobacteraceae bacterium]